MPTVADADLDAYLSAPTPLAFWRRHRGLTQVELSQAADISQPYLAQLENGQREGAVSVYARLAKRLTCGSTTWFPMRHPTPAARDDLPRTHRRPLADGIQPNATMFAACCIVSRSGTLDRPWPAARCASNQPEQSPPARAHTTHRAPPRCSRFAPW
jgi:transcriptional regulator with XRE-family HTH domain